ncbi:MAG: radical SAM protein [Myxococcales bacterium]|nr:MAG: radical SAM protein [Myxococcales bacterium]
MRSLVVHEIYASLQGESSFAGIPCAFVRLTGCNLRCSWCDTPQAFHDGKRLSFDEIIESTIALNTPLVELTGGEPLLQKQCLALLEEFADLGKTVLLETSGERDISGVDSRVHRIMDLKAPGSGEVDRNLWENIAHLTKRDEVKIVVTDRRDFEWAMQVNNEHALSERVAHLWLSPVFSVLDPKELASWILAVPSGARMQLQQHKYIWGPDTPGV